MRLMRRRLSVKKLTKRINVCDLAVQAWISTGMAVVLLSVSNITSLQTYCEDVMLIIPTKL